MNGLEDVKVGDKLLASVCLSSRLRVLTVDRVTPSQVICGTERFNKRNGRAVGRTGFDAYSAWVPEPEQLARVLHEHRLRRVQEAIHAFVVTGENIDAVEKLLRSAA